MVSIWVLLELGLVWRLWWRIFKLVPIPQRLTVWTRVWSIGHHYQLQRKQCRVQKNLKTYPLNLLRQLFKRYLYYYLSLLLLWSLLPQQVVCVWCWLYTAITLSICFVHISLLGHCFTDLSPALYTYLSSCWMRYLWFWSRYCDTCPSLLVSCPEAEGDYRNGLRPSVCTISCPVCISYTTWRISFIFGSHILQVKTMCITKHLAMQGQGHTWRSKVILTIFHHTFMSAPYLANALTDFDIWYKCSQ